MDVHLSKFFKVTAILGGLFTFGLVAIILWVQSRTFPKHIDGQGITLRSGKKYDWSALTKATPVTVVNSRGQRVAGKLMLEFGKKKVNIVPPSYKEGYEVINYINSLLGADLQSG